MNKKVLFIRSTPYDEDPNGYNVQGIGISKAFCRLGYDCDYLSTKKRNQRKYVFYEYNGCKARLIEFPRIRILRTGINKRICNENFLNKYDIIISREYNQIMTYLLSEKSNRVVMYSGPYWNMFMIPFMSRIYDFLFTKKINKNIKYKFAKSVLAKEFMEKKGYTNVYNVGVGLDTERFTDETDIKEDTQKVVDYMQKHRCILYVGNLNDNKNYPFLLEVYKKIIQDEPDVRFVMIGKSKQSAFAKLLGKSDESYAEQYYSQLPDNVKKGIYHVEQIDNPQLKFIYPLAKAFLLPSKLEIFGMVLLEAMYMGAPVVSGRNGGALTLIENGYTGQMVEEFDAVKWKKAVLKYLNDTEYTQAVIDNARRRVKEEYTWDSVVKHMLKYIEGNGDEA